MTVGPEDPGHSVGEMSRGRRDAEASADLWPAPRALFPPQSAVRVRSYKPHRDIAVTSTSGSKKLKMTAHYIDKELEGQHEMR